MLSLNQKVRKVIIKHHLDRRSDIYVKVVCDDVNYHIGDYFPETKQIQFYGARLTAPQIIKIVSLIKTEANQ
jgi:hypothetical protein